MSMAHRPDKGRTAKPALPICTIHKLISVFLPPRKQNIIPVLNLALKISTDISTDNSPEHPDLLPAQQFQLAAYFRIQSGTGPLHQHRSAHIAQLLQRFRII